MPMLGADSPLTDKAAADVAPKNYAHTPIVSAQQTTSLRTESYIYSSKLSSKICRQDFYNDEQSDNEQSSQAFAAVSTRLSAESKDEERFASRYSMQSGDQRGGGRLRGVRAVGRLQRYDSTYVAVPLYSAELEAERFRNVRENSKECICDIVSADVLQRYELVSEQKRQLSEQMKRLLAYSEAASLELQRAREEAAYHWFHTVATMRRDTRFNKFFAAFSNPTCDDLGAFIAQGNTPVEAPANAKNYYRQQYERLYQENDYLIEDNKQLAETVQSITRQFQEKRDYDAKHAETAANADKLEAKELRRQKEQLEAQMKQIEYKAKETENSMYKELDLTKQRTASLETSVERNEPFYAKIAALPAATILKTVLKSPQTLLDDLLNHFYRLDDENKQLSEQLREFQAARDEAAALAAQTRSVGSNTDSAFTHELAYNAARDVRLCCLQGQTTVYRFSQYQLALRELSRKQGEKLTLVELRLQRMQQVVAEQLEQPRE